MRESLRSCTVSWLPFLIAACGGGGSGTETEHQSIEEPSSTQQELAPASSLEAPYDESATAPAFVNQTVTLSWTIPGVRQNGDKLYLYEIGGYQITVYLDGESPDDIAVIDIPGGEVTSYELTLLEPGKWIFELSSYDIDGVYSAYPNTVVFDLNP